MYFVNDLSLVVGKPEMYSRHLELKASLRRRGFIDVHDERRLDGWIEHMDPLYSERFRKEPWKLAAFKRAYEIKKHIFGNGYSLFVVTNGQGDTADKLTREKGDFISYQTKRDGSLRSEFGLGAEHNVVFGDIRATFDAVHIPDPIPE